MIGRMARAPVLLTDDRGLYCPAGDFHVDPWRPVPCAVITHAHSDHARAGMQAYLATPGTAAMLRHRLGEVSVQALAFGVALQIGGATVSLHPSGHLPGAAQVRVEVGGEVCVVSGDYKTEADGLSEPFEPVACHTFITECTFGLPVFRWAPQDRITTAIAGWWQDAASRDETVALGAYSLGKAQRLLHMIAPVATGPILVHPAIDATNAALRAAGYPVPAAARLDGRGKPPRGALVITVPQALATRAGTRAAMASGWMALRGIRRRRGLGQGFAISDHADWPGLVAAIRATGASRVLATHGYTAQLARWLSENGWDAAPLATAYTGEEPA